MPSIVIVAPIQEMVEIAEEACKRLGEDIPIIQATVDRAIEIANDLEEDGTEIIISRGTVAWKLIDSGLNIPIIEIPITGYDLVRAFLRARELGQKIGIADTPGVLQGIESIESMFKCSIEKYAIHELIEMDHGVENLLKRGIDVLIGKGAYVNKVNKRKVNTVLLSSGEESIIQAINEAKKLLSVRRGEVKRRKQVQVILDNIDDGVIAIDESGEITASNPAFQKLFNYKDHNLIGKNIKDILLHSTVNKVFEIETEDLNRIEEVNGNKIITNRIPIKDEDKVLGAVFTFQELQKLQQQEHEIRKKLTDRGLVTKYKMGDVVGITPSFQNALEKLKKYAKVDSTVLLTGETGVGKEVFSQLLHSQSLRANGPFVPVNCAAIPDNLLESELFGYVEGAFTGAKKGGKAGLFELAHQGTIFLDEIGEMAKPLQSRLLRVLQEGEVMRLGDEKVIPINVRVIAASNRDLEAMVIQGEFRADLYYRLNILDITIPPLRERIGDIPLLCDYFIYALKQTTKKEINGFNDHAMKLLQKYDWPGNIRQLRNVVERAMILSTYQTIDEETVVRAGGKDFEVLRYEDSSQLNKREELENKNLLNLEKNHIEDVLKKVNYNKTEAARILGIGRTTLWRKLNNGK
jgi:propionate catabolism operon transcriptional regulator